MTPDELLKPRYKVIADWPGGIFKYGELIEPHTVYGFDIFPYPEKYPHLFKPLAWWEERNPEDMPEYIKPKKAPEYVFKVVSQFDSIVVTYYGTDGKLRMDNTSIFLPATESEYNEFINQSK